MVEEKIFKKTKSSLGASTYDFTPKLLDICNWGKNHGLISARPKRTNTTNGNSSIEDNKKTPFVVLARGEKEWSAGTTDRNSSCPIFFFTSPPPLQFFHIDAQ